jgi:hypothetical protein
MATRVSDDPLVKVKKMVKNLLVRLMEEANEEAEHKGNEQTRKEKTEAVETLSAEVDQLEASIAKLTEGITVLTKAVAELDAAMSTATTPGREEKALTMLKEFYEKAGDAAALLQRQPEAPEIFDAPYKGMQAENGGIVGMLEVVESDFARRESGAEASEDSSQKECDTFVTDPEVDKESKSEDIEHKTAKNQDEEQVLTVKARRAVVAVPAYFNDQLRLSTKDAYVLSGFNALR